MDVLYTFKIKLESQNSEHGCIKDLQYYPNQYKGAKSQSGSSSVPQSPKSGLEKHGCYLHLQNQDWEPKFGKWMYQRPVTISESRSTCQTFCQDSPVSPKAPNQDLTDMDVFCTLKIKIESKIWIMGVSKTIEHVQINIKMSNTSQETSASSEATNEDLKDMDVLCTFVIKIES